MLLLSLACTSPPDCSEGFELRGEHCYAVEQSPDSPVGDSGEPPDSGDSASPLPELELGDPLSSIEGEHYKGWEFLDGEMLDNGQVLAVGQGGWMLADPATGKTLDEGNLDRAYRLTVDGDRAYASARTLAVISLDLSSGSPTMLRREFVTSGYHEDIAADGGRVILGAQEEGVLLLDEELSVQATFPASFGGGVAIEGDTVLATDDEELVLLDLSSGDFVEVDRAPLSGRGRDIAFDGEQIAVAMGSEGVEVYALEGGALTHRGLLEMPGSAFNVSIDGEMLYVGAWEVVVAAWLGGDKPVVVGHEPPKQSAWAVAARDGVLALMDWGYITPMSLNEGVGGSELHLPEQLWIPPGSTDSVALPLRNWGAFELEVDFDEHGLVDVEPSSASIAPGETQVFTLTPTTPWSGRVELGLSSNDPDEEDTRLALQEAEGSLGAEHPEMALEGYEPPSSALEVYDLADYRGKPVFMAYFTTW